MPDKHDMMAERLKRRRSELKLSLQEVAELTDLSKSTLQRYENGHTDKIPLDKLELLANALQVTPMYLMGWEGKDLPYAYFDSIMDLINEMGYELKYDEINEAYLIIMDDGTGCILQDEALKDIKLSVSSFTKFKVMEYINQAKINRREGDKYINAQIAVHGPSIEDSLVLRYKLTDDE